MTRLFLEGIHRVVEQDFQLIMGVMCQTVHPCLYGALTNKRIRPTHELVLSTIHAQRLLGRLSLLFVELQCLDVVKTFGKMFQDELRITSFAQNIEQICSSDKVETRVSCTLRFEVVRQGLFTFFKRHKHVLNTLKAAVKVTRFHGIRDVWCGLHHFLPSRMNHIEPLGFFWKLHSDICRAHENTLQIRPLRLHLFPCIQCDINHTKLALPSLHLHQESLISLYILRAHEVLKLH